ncbi:hypothetical protein CVS40_10497 [Lucilia cuprina]|nr:hypothetical protein CVS40_10497 [Lucilia cuprina]
MSNLDVTSSLFSYAGSSWVVYLLFFGSLSSSPGASLALLEYSLAPWEHSLALLEHFLTLFRVFRRLGFN